MKPITLQEYMKVIFQLPEHINDVKYVMGFDAFSDQIQSNGITFKWIEKDKVWEVVNPIRVKGFNRKWNMFCRKCNSTQEHIVNKTSTKVKCKKCETITDLKL